MKCKICFENTRHIFSTILLKKYNVGYYCCENCGFVQSEDPYWLKEAYDDAITGFDIGYAQRNVSASFITRSIILFFFNSNGSYIDYGGGYGLFVRFMRDYGFDFYRHDIYCQNIFSKHFDVFDYESRSFELMTAFEVFEHLVDPVSELEKMLSFGDNILFSTKLYSFESKKIKDWWYLAPRFGQHISLYSKKSLQILGSKHGLNYYTDGRDIHLFTKKRINKFLFRLCAINKFSALIYFLKLGKRRSLLDSDLRFLENKFNKL